MGRGKKKDKKGDPKQEEPKKEEDLSLASLSIRDEASTSRETSAPPEEEDEGGLTGGGRKKKPKKKAEAPPTLAPVTTEAAATVPPTAVAPTVAPAVAPTVVPAVAPEVTPSVVAPVPVESKPEEQKAAEEDDGGLGLGLGGGKKRRPRKKKEATIEAAAAAKPAVEAAAAPKPTHTTPPAGPSPVPGTPRLPWGAPQATQPAPQATQPAKSVSQPVVPRAQAPPGFPAAPTRGPPGFHPQASAPVSHIGQQPTTPTHIQPKGSRGDIQQHSDTTLCRFKIPAKIIGNSVRSRPIQVLTNYLPMTIKPLKIHRYDVSFKPDKPKKMIPRAFIKAKEKLFPKHLIAFDQMKNCYALTPLPGVTSNDRFLCAVDLQDNNGKTMNFEVSFKATGIVDLNTILQYMDAKGTSLNPPTEAIQCIDVILRQGTLESYIKAGRQFFKRPSRPIPLGDGLEMWTGLFQSAIFTSRPFINIDVAHKGFPIQQPLVDAISKSFRMDLSKPVEYQRGRNLETFLMFIKNLRVVATIGGDSSAKGQKREFICNELVDPPNKLTFTMTTEGGRDIQMTVADYFAKEKKIRLRYPNFNCVWVGPRDKKIYYPAELLEVAYGQAQNKQLNDLQLSTMVKEAATPPDERKRKIQEVIQDMKYSQNTYFKQFGLEIKDEFFPVQAKVLMPPRLDVGGSGPVDPRKGAWQANRLLKPEALESWGFVAIELDYNASNAQYIINLMIDNGRRLGMRVSELPPDRQYYNVRITSLQNVLFDALKKEIKFLVIIVATRGRDYYHRVKKMAERDVGILTQCIKEFTATKRMNDQTAKNILLKVNSKLMGINQALDGRSMPRCLAEGKVMVVGADVTHPSPDQTSVPSIAAVTASIDPKCFIYNIQLSVQTPKKEMIVEFEDMMVEHLQVYRQRQRELPRKIFVFRDGVSEGQFAQVMNSELQAVHNAYARLAGPNAKPEVLFLLVQKRHHTRLFIPNSPQNVEPGTVVDTHIVHAKELDFYLVSHQAIKGTARPTRYHAVCNDGGIPHDEVEQLAYYLCHLYSRCMRSVSYPTPTYYAHLACLRARSLTFGDKFNNAELEKKPQRLNVMDKILESSRMFFV